MKYEGGRVKGGEGREEGGGGGEMGRKRTKPGEPVSWRSLLSMFK